MRAGSFLFGLGVLLASIPGLFTAQMRLASSGCLLFGGMALVAAVVLAGVFQPRSAMLLLGASSLSFWLSCGFWQLRVRTAGPSARGGIDAFAGALAEWVVLLVLFSVYEAGIFLWGSVWNRQRSVALLGLVALFIQTLTSLRFAYRLVQGV